MKKKKSKGKSDDDISEIIEIATTYHRLLDGREERDLIKRSQEGDARS